MSDPRDPALKQAVGRLMRDAQSLHDLFLLNYRDEANRPKLQTGYETLGIQIQTNLYTLIRKFTQLKSALNTPNSNYNQFISAWNNGTGVLLSSFNRLTEFMRSLQTAQPELDRLMAPQPVPGPQPPGPHGTAAEVAVFTRLRSEVNDLWEVFKSCVTNHTPSAASKIKEHVRVIGELLNNSSLGHDAVTKLTNSKREWTDFIARYKNGLEITNSSFSQLGHFVTFTNIACAQVLG